MKVADAISAIARCRSSGANSTGITESDSGKMAAAPIPSTARRRDQLAGAGRVRARRRTGPEQDERDQQHLLAPQPVAEQARGQHRGRQHQAVRVGDPLQVAGRGVQVGRDRGQRQVEHGQVEPDDEHARRDGDQRPPLASRVPRHDSHIPSAVTSFWKLLSKVCVHHLGVSTENRARVPARCPGRREQQMVTSWPGDDVSANIQARHDRARDNQAYVRDLLAERQPGFAAFLQAVERQLDPGRPHDPCDWRRTMNTAWLYHLDGSGCVDGWSCQQRDHTSIPPRCGVLAPAGRPAASSRKATRVRTCSSRTGNAAAPATAIPPSWRPRAAAPSSGGGSAARCRRGCPGPSRRPSRGRPRRRRCSRW